MVGMNNTLKQLFQLHDGVMRTCELNAAGFYNRKIRSLVQSGQIEQIRRGYYQYVGENSFSDIPALRALFPDGVLCMESALDHYGYTDRTPSAWHLAVDSKSSRARFHIDYPIVHPHFIQSSKYPVGITTGTIDGYEIKIYDRERTVCDLLLHRNKVDSEVFNTAIQRYVKDPQKNDAHLAKYAKQLHVERKMQEVIGPWL